MLIYQNEKSFKDKNNNNQTNQPKKNNNNQNIIFPENYDLTKLENMNTYLNYYQPKFKENFELSEYIDSGSTGVVYKGRSKEGGKSPNYAFKFCIKLQKEKRHIKNNYHDIYYQKKLHHKNISQILAFYKIEEKSYFSVSELGKYGNIDYFVHNFLKRSYLSETFTNYLTYQILEGLNYMHRKKIYHMDIKKGNIVLDSELNPKLIDFSSCISLENYSPEDEIQLVKIGTGRYMAPELLKKLKIKVKYVDKIDLYSLGVTIFNLAFGCYPYKLNTVKSDEYDKILEQLKEENFEFPNNIEVSNQFKDFMKHLLELDYQKRYSIKDALNHPWIKGWNIIAEEKENTGVQENFIIKLISDNIPKFNQYIK